MTMLQENYTTRGRKRKFTPDKIQKINKTFLNHDDATDVIAFGYPKNSGPAFGDIYISVDTARCMAQRGGYPLAQELALMLAHGLLHLAGYDDLVPEKKKKMFAKQNALFKKIDPGLAPPDCV